MEYITGFQALNLKSSLKTSGLISGFHYFGHSERTSVQWDDLNLAESKNSFFEDYGIEKIRWVPKHEGEYFVANHCRVLLDFLADSNSINNILGARYYIIDNDDYNEKLFSKTIELKALPHWDMINKLMGFEYGLDWLEFLLTKGIKWPNSVWGTEADGKGLPSDTLREYLRVLACDFVLSMNLNDLELYLSKIFENENELTPGTYKDIKYFLSESVVDYVDYFLLTQPFYNKRKLVKTLSKACRLVGLIYKTQVTNEKWEAFL